MILLDRVNDLFDLKVSTYQNHPGCNPEPGRADTSRVTKLRELQVRLCLKAAIAVMNIMLVSVPEGVSENGVRMARGALIFSSSS